ncbi:MAG: 50S ribosomal protein L20 [Puniceicoccales bacterium]|jgi:large subunit ribosomal protein L20|nr:50S ribosomal protein L20 [Puniceicoccales bacterium]
MPRVVNAVATKKRRKRLLKRARGYFGNKSRLFRYAREEVRRADAFAYRDRKRKKTAMRGLWIIRINAACRQNGIQYCRFIAALKKLNINLDRRALSELAIGDAEAFGTIIEKAKATLLQ